MSELDPLPFTFPSNNQRTPAAAYSPCDPRDPWSREDKQIRVIRAIRGQKKTSRSA